MSGRWDGVVERIPVGPVPLQVVHRGVGVVEQCLGRRVVGVQADADADGHGVVVPVHRDRAGDRLGDPLGHLVGERRRHQLTEMSRTTTNSSTAPPGHRVAGPQHVPQAAGDMAQHLVAGHVAVGVVDPLEAVQVAREHRDPAASARPGAGPARCGRRSGDGWASPVSSSCSAACSRSRSIVHQVSDVTRNDQHLDDDAVVVSPEGCQATRQPAGITFVVAYLVIHLDDLAVGQVPGRGGRSRRACAHRRAAAATRCPHPAHDPDEFRSEPDQGGLLPVRARQLTGADVINVDDVGYRGDEAWLSAACTALPSNWAWTISVMSATVPDHWTIAPSASYSTIARESNHRSRRPKPG